MCGIVGVLARRRADSELVARLAALLRHRGPDDEGLVAIDVDGGRALPLAGADTMAEAIGGEHPYLPRGTVADAGPWDVVLASRRLAIIDLSAAGHQPLCSPDGRAWIVHNGEIYNYVELRRELSALGHRFRGGSDTEVALAAYREWRTDCLRPFYGLWGMAIWDGEQRRLVLSRDRFGVKPLYFADADQFVFASELKAIVASGAVTPAENEAAVATFLATGRIDVRGDETSFADVCQVEPGCYVVRSLDGAAQQRRYYDLVARVRPARATELLDVLVDAVALRLRSDVPVGSSLSGGVDSSAVVALAQRRLGPRWPMHTFTFASRAADDETEFAALVARHVGAGNVATEVPDLPLPDLLAQLVWEQDEPIGSGSVLAQRQVMERAHEDGLKVLLDGQGGDEVLAGYKHYVATNLADLLARGRLLRWVCRTRPRSTPAGRRWRCGGRSRPCFRPRSSGGARKCSSRRRNAHGCGARCASSRWTRCPRRGPARRPGRPRPRCWTRPRRRPRSTTCGACSRSRSGETCASAPPSTASPGRPSSSAARSRRQLSLSAAARGRGCACRQARQVSAPPRLGAGGRGGRSRRRTGLGPAARRGGGRGDTRACTPRAAVTAALRLGRRGAAAGAQARAPHRRRARVGRPVRGVRAGAGAAAALRAGPARSLVVGAALRPAATRSSPPSGSRARATRRADDGREGGGGDRGGAGDRRRLRPRVPGADRPRARRAPRVRS